MDTVNNMEDLNILTFNSHQAYCYGFSSIGARIFVVHEIPGKDIRKWDVNIRPCPDNITLISMPRAVKMYEKGLIDLVVCHNISDLMEVSEWQIKKMLCVHETVRGRIVTERSRIGRRDWSMMVKAYLNRIKDVHTVFVSKKKARDWGLDGSIIELGVDPHDYCGYSGAIPSALTVSNGLKMRGRILGYDIHQGILDGRPCEIVGHDPGLPGSKRAANWVELKEKYRQNRVYLFTALEEYEDGYNTAMLEAMATGMPVISYTNDTSPVIDGVNGYISNDVGYLMGRLDRLLKDRDEAVRLGREARRTAVERFGIDRHVRKWRRLIKSFM